MPHEAEVAVPASPAPRGQPDRKPEMAAVMERASLGDQAAFAEVHAEYSRLTYRRCLQVLKTTDAALDANQEIWMRIWSARTRYQRQAASVRSWVLAIANNRLVDIIRKNQTQPQLHGEELSEIPLAQRVAYRTSVVNQIFAREALRKIRLHLCDEDFYLLMGWAYGETYEALEDNLAIPLGTIKSRISRIRKRVEILLGDPVPGRNGSPLDDVEKNVLVVEAVLDPKSGLHLPSLTRGQLMDAVDAAEIEEEE